MSLKLRLFEVDVCRAIVTVLLLILHSFAIYTGAWPRPEDIDYINLYYWIGKLPNGFMLQTYVLISGYLWGRSAYNVIHPKIGDTIKSKAIRLLIPGILFSTLYYILFVYNGTFSLSDLFIIFSGSGHLWFLPMLFWCFVFSALSHRFIKDARVILFLSLILCIISVNVRSLGLGGATYYYLFFEVGAYIYMQRNKHDKINGSLIFFVLVIFLVLFVPITKITDKVAINITTSNTIETKLLWLWLKNIVSLPLAIVGGVLCMSISFYIARYYYNYCNSAYFISKHSFSIYLWHQFILISLYQWYEFRTLCGEYFLPWCGLVVSSIVSIFLSVSTKQFALGRKYL